MAKKTPLSTFRQEGVGCELQGPRGSQQQQGMLVIRLMIFQVHNPPEKILRAPI